MSGRAPDFPPITRKQEELLAEIKYWKTELQKEIQLLPKQPDDLSFPKLIDYIEGPEFSKLVNCLNKLKRDIDELTVKALRSGLARRFKDDTSVFIKLHPDLPSWAVDHFTRWGRDKRCIRIDEKYYLLADCKMGLETGLRRPKSFTLLEKVLYYRGFDINLKEVAEKLSKQQSWTKDKIIKAKRGRPGKRIRKNNFSWDWIALQLQKQGLPSISGEGLKKRLKREWPDIDWDKV